MGNNCNGIPSNMVQICATINVTFSSGNASFQYGYIINNVKTPVSAIINSAGMAPLMVDVCVTVSCSAAVQFYITAWTNLNGGGSICTQSNVTVTSISYTPLPVELASFSSKIHKDGNLILWNTLSETNNDHFILEKSTNARDWTKVSKIKGKGNSQSLTEYTYLDVEIFPLTYYRLLQVDFDGKSSLSHIIKHHNESYKNLSHSITLYPNPTNDVLYLDFELENDFTFRRVINTLGKEFNNIHFINGTIDVSNLEKGIYFLCYSQNNIQYTKKFLKL